MADLQISSLVQRRNSPRQLLGQIVGVEPNGKYRILALGTPTECYRAFANIRTIVVALIESYQYFHEAPEDIEIWDSSELEAQNGK